MNEWNLFPFGRIALAACTGILAFEKFPYLWKNTFPTLLFFVASFSILWFLNHRLKIRVHGYFIGFIGLSLIAFSFGHMAFSKNELNESSHWRHVDGPISAFEGKVISDVNHRKTSQRYTVKVSQVLSPDSAIRTEGRLHLYIKNTPEDQSKTLRYGDIIRIRASPAEIPPPTNPEEFNYSAYMARKQIHGQCFVENEEILVVGNQPDNAALALAYTINNRLETKILKHIKDPDSRSIANALLIGNKDYLSEELKTAYASAGAMHVLAVSGLHVGILYIVLLSVFRPIKKKKIGRIFFSITSIGIIWLYALVTGMSPSVMRAAVMFTVMAISEAIDRDNNIYNSLGIAAFILLLWDPNLLFAVGFQLSFLALCGIVYLQPKIYNLMYVPNRFLNKVWEITAVSVAAQISTLPLTVYYFHQFPSYFFLSNLVVIPGAMIIMFLGIALIGLDSILSEIGAMIGFILDHVIQFMNYIVLKVESLPGSLITWLYIDSTQTWLIYFALIFCLLGIHYKSLFYLTKAAVIVLIVIVLGHNSSFNQSRKEELVLYDIYETTIIDYIKGHQAILFVESENEIDSALVQFQIDPFRRANRLKPYDYSVREFSTIDDASNLKMASISNQRILILDSLQSNVSLTEPLRTDILIINNQSVKNVGWLQAHFHFKRLIIGSDNSKYYSKWLKSELEKHDINAHSLLIDGSLRLDIVNAKKGNTREI